jgi:tetratricopeptide (TPR) repeat protein
VTAASKTLAKAQETAAARGLRVAAPLFVEAADELGRDQQYGAAVQTLLDVLNVREKKRGLFGTKEINPLGPDRNAIGKHFAKWTHRAPVNDSILELLGALSAEFPDDAGIRFANAEALYRAAYVADAIDEYRYCERMRPDDGALVARLGELYALMSRNDEAEQNLRRGIGMLRQANQHDLLVPFMLKLLEVKPQAAAEAIGWLEAVPQASFSEQRDAIVRICEAASQSEPQPAGLAAVRQRLASLPPRAVIAPISKTPSVWEDSSGMAPASEDEMRMLLGPERAPADASPGPNRSAQPADAAQSKAEESKTRAQAEQTSTAEQQAALQRVSAAKPQVAPKKPMPGKSDLPIMQGRRTSTAVPAVPPVKNVAVVVTSASPQPAGATAPESPSSPPPAGAPVPQTPEVERAPALPPGLAAYTRRKAAGMFSAGDIEGAKTCYERLLTGAFDSNDAAALLRCYLKLERYPDASKLGLELSSELANAGDLEAAVRTLTDVLERAPDAALLQRRAELQAASVV